MTIDISVNKLRSVPENYPSYLSDVYPHENTIPLRLVVDIFASDFIFYDDVFRAVGIHFDLNHSDTGKGPDISFSLANFSGIWESLTHRDLLPPLIKNNRLTDQLFGLSELPTEHYKYFAKLYSKRKILVRDGQGELRKARG